MNGASQRMINSNSNAGNQNKSMNQTNNSQPPTREIERVIDYKGYAISIWTDGTASFSGLRYGSEEVAKRKLDAFLAIKIIDCR